MNNIEIEKIIDDMVNKHLESDKRYSRATLNEFLNSNSKIEKEYKSYLKEKYSVYKNEILEYCKIFNEFPKYEIDSLKLSVVLLSHEKGFSFNLSKENKNIILDINSWSEDLYITESKKISITIEENLKPKINPSLKSHNDQIINIICAFLNDKMKNNEKFINNIEPLLSKIKKISNFMKNDILSNELELIENKDLLLLNQDDFDLMKLTTDNTIKNKILKIQGILKSPYKINNKIKKNQ